MLLTSLTLTAAGLAAAHALLIPPELSDAIHHDEGGDTVNALPVAVPKIAESQVFNLDCPRCPMNHKDHGGGIFGNRHIISNHLELTFNIDHDADADRLKVNGFELFPNADPLRGILSAPQIPHFEGRRHGGNRIPLPPQLMSPVTAPLGYSLQVSREAHDTEENLSLVNINLQIIEVGTSFVEGVQNVQIKLIQSLDGALMIGDIHATESQTTHANPLDKQEECTTVYCKWKAIVADRFKGHCPGKMNAGKVDKIDWKIDYDDEGSSRLHHEGNDVDEHAHFYTDRSWAQLFHKFASHILFPVLIGIVAGISVSIIGMIVGTLIIGIWRVVVRRQPFFHRHHHCRRRGSHHRKTSRSEPTALAEEKAALMDEQELPPAYGEDEQQHGARETA